MRVKIDSSVTRRAATAALFVGLTVGTWEHPVQAKEANPFRLTAGWNVGGVRRELNRWSLTELNQFKPQSSREKDPSSGKVVSWGKGILLSKFLEKVLEGLPLESRAQVDLVGLVSLTGERVLIPRALISRYPILLGFQDSNPTLVDEEMLARGYVYSVVPWTSKPKILKEDVPLNLYFVRNIVRVELTNYRDQYSSLYLKRRTDPSAMRGEKLFVQNCVQCHAVGMGKVPSWMSTASDQKAKAFVASGHPAIKETVKVSEHDRRAIVRYLDALQIENPTSSSRAVESVQNQSSNTLQN